MGDQNRTVDDVIAAIAFGQHGVVARRQLLDAGVSRKAIEVRLRRGSLIAEFTGAYRVGHRAPSTLATYMGAALACGDGSLLHGAAGAHLYEVRRGVAPPPTVLTPTERRIDGIITTRSRADLTPDATRHRGIPVTTLARVVVDLAAFEDVTSLARICHEAGIRHDLRPDQVEEVLARRRCAPGAGALRRILHGDVNVSLSVLETRLLALLREHGLPLPVTNQIASGRRVDARWPEHRLTVEVDGYRFHRSRHAWELDRRREREARARGDEFRRYTYGDVVEDPGYLLAELRELLLSHPGPL